MSDESASVSNNNLLQYQLGPKLISIRHRNGPQYFRTPNRRSPQLAERQILGLVPQQRQSLGHPSFPNAIYKYDSREGFECGDVSL